jgi:hypothetical protein
MESKAGVGVFFYGHATAQQTPLATVRGRESTQFFRSLPTISSNSNSSTSTSLDGVIVQATVGASPHFVENWNVHLNSNCDKATAQGLTKEIQGRDGGLPFVEALNLPYGPNRFEVACNLLNPKQTSSDDIEAKVQAWEHHHDLVEKGYRVGTTVDMCLQALEQMSTPESEVEYNRQVRKRLEGYLKSVSSTSD